MSDMSLVTLVTLDVVVPELDDALVVVSVTGTSTTLFQSADLLPF